MKDRQKGEEGVESIGLDRQTDKEERKGDRNMQTGDKVTDRDIES
jgi:hypothetical protein